MGEVLVSSGNACSQLPKVPLQRFFSTLARFLHRFFQLRGRYSDHPNIPTSAELGYPDAVLPTYVGLYVHKKTPDPIKQKLMDVCKKIYEDLELKKGIEKIGENPRFGGPEFLREAIKRQEEIGIPILKEIGIYVGQ